MPSCRITVVLPYAGRTHPARKTTTVAARIAGERNGNNMEVLYRPGADPLGTERACNGDFRLPWITDC